MTTGFSIMMGKTDKVIKKIKRDVPFNRGPEARFIFIKAIQAQLVVLEKETLKRITG